MSDYKAFHGVTWNAAMFQLVRLQAAIIAYVDKQKPEFVN